MPGAFLILLACQLLGEVLRSAFSLPIPGPVIGMFLLAGLLVIRALGSRKAAIPAPLEQVAESLIAHMGLLFVPAGVGIIAEAGLLEQQWLPILGGLIGSTLLGIAVTGAVMHWTIPAHQSDRATPKHPSNHEALHHEPLA